jgi:hypothetical protein
LHCKGCFIRRRVKKSLCERRLFSDFDV